MSDLIITQTAQITTLNWREGPKAFAQKRTPDWQG